MERRGFFRALLGLAASVVAAPTAIKALAEIPKTVKPMEVSGIGSPTGITYYQDQNTLIVDDGEIGYGDVTVK